MRISARSLALVGLSAAWLTLNSVAAVAQENPREFGRVDRQTLAREKAHEPKVFGPLRKVLPPSGVLAPLPSDTTPFALEREGLIPVTIHTTTPGEAVALLSSLGRRPAHVVEDVIEAYVAPSDVTQLSALASVTRIEAVEPPQTQAVVSQGRTVHNASAWISGGYTGTGVKVGVIDSFKKVSDAIALGELPTPVSQRCYTAIGVYTTNIADCNGNSSEHGTAVAESLVDIAPNVQLYIASPISQGDLRASVDWMVSQGVKVINYSVGWFWDGPGDGTSPYANSPLKTVDAAVAGGAVWVNAAGNGGRSTYYGPYADTDADNFVEFTSATGAGEALRLPLVAGQQVRIQLRWGTDSWTAAQKDLDLMLVAPDASTVVASSLAPQSGSSGHIPLEVLQYTAPAAGTYYVLVERYSGTAPTGIQLQVWDGAFWSGHNLSGAGSIGNPAESSNSGMLAVGAANWQTPTTIESFSSRGPTPYGQIKPDIVGVDRADTWAYGVNAFAGTSQAAPHVAGLAALVKGAFPSYTPQQVVSYLKARAEARGTVPNSTWGVGLAKLPNVCSVTVSTAVGTLSASGGSLNVGITAGAGCAWTAATSAGWLTASPTSGSGNGTVVLSASANTAAAARTTTATIGGQTVTVTQAAGSGGSSPMVVSSSAFENGGAIPVANLCAALGGTGTSFPVSFGNIPAGTVTLAVNIQDPDVPLAYGGPTFDHWTRWNLSPSLGGFAAGGMTGGTNTTGAGYFPPCPPPGTGVHRYILTLYALDTTLSGSYSSKAALEAAMSGRVLATATTLGLAGTPTVTVSPMSWSAPGGGGTQVVTVTASSASAAWTASSNQPWLTLSPSSGTGSGTVTLTAAANTTGTDRSATVLIGGRAVTVTQQGTTAGVQLSQIVTGSTVNLSWTPLAGATAYRLEAGLSPGASNAAVVTLAQLGFVATDVPNGVYFVRVAALGDGGSVLAVSNEVTVTVGPPVCLSAPGAPGQFSHTVSGATVTMTWQPAAAGCPASGFLITAGLTSGNGNLAQLPVAGTSTTVTAPPGVYYVRVFATNAYGTSPASNEIAIAVGPTSNCYNNYLCNGVPSGPEMQPAGDSYNTQIVIGSGVSRLTIQTFGGSGDADLYVRRNAYPTLSSYDCASTGDTNDETCTFTNPLPGTYYIKVHAFRSFSGLYLMVSTTGGS